MTEARRRPTPAEGTYYGILHGAEEEALAKVVSALKEAQRVAAAGFSASGLDGAPPPYEYFASVIHQQMYCILCGADPQTYAGGDPAVAIHVIRNSQNIARHYWGADIEPYPRSPSIPPSGGSDRRGKPGLPGT